MKVTKQRNPSTLDGGVIGPTTSVKTPSPAFVALFSFCFGTGVLVIFAKQQVSHFSLWILDPGAMNFSSLCSSSGLCVCARALFHLTPTQVSKVVIFFWGRRQKQKFSFSCNREFFFAFQAKITIILFKDYFVSIVNDAWYKNQISFVSWQLKGLFQYQRLSASFDIFCEGFYFSYS